jgi:hypothetical protein
MASKRRFRRNSCGDKKRYSTLKEAQTAAWKFDRARNDTCHAYKCQFGDHFHIGHPTKAVRQAIAARQRAKKGWAWE